MISLVPHHHLACARRIRSFFSLVIPTYNERENIEPLLGSLVGLLNQHLPGDYEIIVVDDDCPDRTWEAVQAFAIGYPQLKVIRRQGERGLSTAVLGGWQAAEGEVLGVMDGDLQHSPGMVLNLLEVIRLGADLAVASRHVRGGGVSDWNIFRQLLSRGEQALGLVLLPEVLGRVSDPMSGYFLGKRKTIADRSLNPVGYKILIEILAKGDVRHIEEVGYVFQERCKGGSKVTWRQCLEYLHHLGRLRLSLTKQAISRKLK